MTKRQRSTLHASKLFSALLLAWTGCPAPAPVEPPDANPVGCEATGGCGNLGSTFCYRVHKWDVLQFGTDQDDVGVAVSSDDECNIYVAGNTRGLFSGAGNLNVSEAGAMQDVFFARIASVDGTSYPSTDPVPFPEYRLTQLGSQGDDSVKDLAIAEDRTAFLVGSTAGRMPGASEPSLGFNDIFATRLNVSGTRQWTRQYGSVEEDVALAVGLYKKDGALNVYLAGTTQEHVSQGYEITLDRLDSNGGVVARNAYGTSDHDRAEGLAIDSSGSLYIVGSTTGDYKEPGSHAGSTDVFVTKVAQQNLDEEAWKSQVSTPDIDAALDVVVDNVGNLYVLAVSFSDLDQGQSENDGIQNSFLLKYSVGNDRPEWIKRIGVKSQYSRATGMALDAEGKVYVAGFTTGSMEDGKWTAGGRDAFVARYDAEGVKDWARQIGTSGNDEASDVVVTKAGDVIITGFTTGNLCEEYCENSGRQDVFLARFNPNSQQ